MSHQVFLGLSIYGLLVDSLRESTNHLVSKIFTKRTLFTVLGVAIVIGGGTIMYKKRQPRILFS